MTFTRTEHDRVGELIELAGYYFVEGAPQKAAVRLRQAAEICDQIATRAAIRALAAKEVE